MTEANNHSIPNGIDCVEEILSSLETVNYNELSAQEKKYIEQYFKKEVKARKHLKQQFYSTVMALMFLKFFTFYESSFFLIIRLVQTWCIFSFAETARSAIRLSQIFNGEVNEIIENINSQLARRTVVDSPSTEGDLNHGNMSHELNEMNNYNTMSSSRNTGDAANINSSADGGEEAMSEEPDSNTGTVTFLSRFAAINFRIELNANFGHRSDPSEANYGNMFQNLTSVTPEMAEAIKTFREDLFMQQFNKYFKTIIYSDILMIIFRVVFPLSVDTFKQKRGYAFIDIFSDYKKFPEFLNGNAIGLNIYNLFFEFLILGSHIGLYQVGCLETPSLHKLTRHMVLFQYRCKQYLKTQKDNISLNDEKALKKHVKPFNLVTIDAIDSVRSI